MYIIKTLFFIIICFATACSVSNTDENDYITIPVNLKENALNLSMLFDSIEPIYLETCELSLVGNDPKIFFTESIILVGSHNKIDFFDFKGKFLRSINKKGNGYGEYIAIDDFYINEEIQRIEILDKKQKKILYYNYNGEYLDNLSLGFWALKIIRDSQNYLYVYSGYDRDGDNIYQFNVFDEKGRHSFHETDKKKSKFLHISNPINFHKNIKIRCSTIGKFIFVKD